MNDELLTVALALHHAGYPSVIATGWTIDDADARNVAHSVYHDLTASGRPDSSGAALAIHHATRRLRVPPISKTLQAESALENCQVQAARVAPISAIPGSRRAQLVKGVRLRK